MMSDMFGIKYLTLSGLLGLIFFFHRAMPCADIFCPFRASKRPKYYPIGATFLNYDNIIPMGFNPRYFNVFATTTKMSSLRDLTYCMLLNRRAVAFGLLIINS
jgi:hypothetical protein